MDLFRSLQLLKIDFRLFRCFAIFGRKSSFFAKNAKIHATSRMDKNRSRPRMTLLKASLERFWSIFSNSNFIFDFLSLFASKTVSLPPDRPFRTCGPIYRFGYKKASKYRNFMKKFPNLKVCVLSFQMTCQASPNDF